MSDNRPKVWIAVFVVKDWKFLMWKRKSKLWEWTWSITWGHLEFAETWEGCGKREVFEETWITVKDLKFIAATNDIFDDKHYITIYLLSNYDKWEVRLMEPDKFEKWDWFTVDSLPDNIFIPLKNLLDTWFNPLDNHEEIRYTNKW